MHVSVKIFLSSILIVSPFSMSSRVRTSTMWSPSYTTQSGQSMEDPPMQLQWWSWWTPSPGPRWALGTSLLSSTASMYSPSPHPTFTLSTPSQWWGRSNRDIHHHVLRAGVIEGRVSCRCRSTSEILQDSQTWYCPERTLEWRGIMHQLLLIFDPAITLLVWLL